MHLLKIMILNLVGRQVVKGQWAWIYCYDPTIYGHSCDGSIDGKVCCYPLRNGDGPVLLSKSYLYCGPEGIIRAGSCRSNTYCIDNQACGSDYCGTVFGMKDKRSFKVQYLKKTQLTFRVEIYRALLKKEVAKE